MQRDDENSGDIEVDAACFAELVREHYTPALRHAARLVRDAAEAEDCVQEAFVEIFQHLGSLRDRKAAPAWVRSIVRHRCLRRMRRRELALLSPSSELDERERPPHERDDERPERRALARLLVASLPAHEREIVVLFYVKECSQREIASFLGLPLSTVNNRLHDARERMKKWETSAMETTRIEAVARDDRALRIGTVVGVDGPLIEARFEPDAPVSLFDAVAIVDGEGRCVERMKVAHYAGDGRVVCLSTSSDDAALGLGTSVLNTGKVGLELTRFGGVRGVSPENLQAVAATLGGGEERAFRPTGIKAVDLLCPLPSRGVVAQAATGGVGRLVLLDEIAHRLARAPVALRWLCLVDGSEPDAYRGWDETSLWGKNGGLGFYWALSRQGTDPELGALDACDAAIYMTPLLAVPSWYPAIDPEHSRSRLLTPAIVGEEHCALAARVREELVFLKRASADPVLLELLATRALAAARRRALANAAKPTLGSGADALRLGRARKLQLFLTQPFGVASEVTGWAGVDVPIRETLAGCRAILDGAVDALPEGAFAYAGDLEEVRRHARDGVARVYGRK
ncbi:MAG TPA: sigma-70 family RNA polymerase sigma factor [Polyangiaceae bacterium]|nr:sigma-70 family RNA polymerase sigma factor [Polyangiaceae bacterium]